MVVNFLTEIVNLENEKIEISNFNTMKKFDNF